MRRPADHPLDVRRLLRELRRPARRRDDRLVAARPVTLDARPRMRFRELARSRAARPHRECARVELERLVEAAVHRLRGTEERKGGGFQLLIPERLRNLSRLPPILVRALRVRGPVRGPPTGTQGVEPSSALEQWQQDLELADRIRVETRLDERNGVRESNVTS